MLNYFIYRNHTVEHLFKEFGAAYSGYGDISTAAEETGTIIWFYFTPLGPNVDEVVSEIESFYDKLLIVIQQRPSASYIIFLLTDRLLQTWSHADRKISKAINTFNNRVEDLCSKESNLKLVDLNHFLTEYSKNDFFDWKYFYISDIIIHPKLAKAFGSWFRGKVSAIAQKRKKALVVDLDNTLWGGILGEDGPEGIQLNDIYPGKAFLHFQQNLLQAAQNGIILSICSKNNEKDVEELWSKHPFMLLKKEHFAAFRINWQNKVENLVEISEELNIGLDSIVFLDDNPAEREIIKQNLPDVSVPDFPEQPYQLPRFFDDVYNQYFQIYALTEEDKSKTAQYLQNTQRKTHQQHFVNMDEYLQSLEMELTVHFANKFNIVRIAQMTQKTNQFNLTTRRYTEKDIQQFIDKGSIVVCLGVKDKFGDNGITAASIITITDDNADIDSYLLSCRTLGRGIEKVLIFYIANLLLDRGIKRLCARYIPSSKNKQTAMFYDSLNFITLEENADGMKEYVLELKNKFNIPSYYKFMNNNNEDANRNNSANFK
ncbi:MAG: hypothetical protein JWQ09_2808 [Segetibacter sp.]|nr:hypothetical protein [Segetibacter sp.]